MKSSLKTAFLLCAFFWLIAPPAQGSWNIYLTQEYDFSDSYIEIQEPDEIEDGKKTFNVYLDRALLKADAAPNELSFGIQQYIDRKFPELGVFDPNWVEGSESPPRKKRKLENGHSNIDFSANPSEELSFQNLSFREALQTILNDLKPLKPESYKKHKITNFAGHTILVWRSAKPAPNIRLKYSIEKFVNDLEKYAERENFKFSISPKSLLHYFIAKDGVDAQGNSSLVNNLAVFKTFWQDNSYQRFNSYLTYFGCSAREFIRYSNLSISVIQDFQQREGGFLPKSYQGLIRGLNNLIEDRKKWGIILPEEYRAKLSFFLPKDIAYLAEISSNRDFFRLTLAQKLLSIPFKLYLTSNRSFVNEMGTIYRVLMMNLSKATDDSIILSKGEELRKLSSAVKDYCKKEEIDLGYDTDLLFKLGKDLDQQAVFQGDDQIPELSFDSIVNWMDFLEFDQWYAH